MAIKKMVLSFQYVKFSEARLKSLLQRGNWMRKHYADEMKFVPTKHPDVEIGYKLEGWGKDKAIEFFIYYLKKCVGNVTFDYADGMSEKPLRRLFRGRKIAVPHVGFDKSFRGLGYPSMLYGLALKKGTVLVSDHHTPEAAKLWEAVARKYKAKLMYTSEYNSWQLSPTPVDPDEWKVMFI